MTVSPLIIDLGIGNIASLANAFRFLGVEPEMGNSPDQIQQASHLVLPGVGAIDPAMEAIDTLNIRKLLADEALGKKKPLIGICLGMQLLFQSSDEGVHNGLGLIDGKLVLIEPTDPTKAVKVPHAGFSEVALENKSGFFDGLRPLESFYFTHSYALPASAVDFDAAICSYGMPFVAAFRKDNLFGTQFHPEKSQSAGLRCLINFLRYSKQP